MSYGVLRGSYQILADNDGYIGTWVLINLTTAEQIMEKIAHEYSFKKEFQFNHINEPFIVTFHECLSAWDLLGWIHIKCQI